VDNEKRLALIGKILEAMGEPYWWNLCKERNHYTSSEEVFYDLANYLQLPNARSWGVEDLTLLPSPRELSQHLEKLKKEEAGKMFAYVTDKIRESGVGDSQEVISDTAAGIVRLLHLFREHGLLRNDPRKEDPKQLYQSYVEKYGDAETAMGELKEDLADIFALYEGDVLLFLRKYKARSGVEMPIGELSFSLHKWTEEVLERAGFITWKLGKREEIGDPIQWQKEKMKEIGQQYFKIPLIAEYGIRKIWRNCCGSRPDCRNCPISHFKGEKLCFRNM